MFSRCTYSCADTSFSYVQFKFYIFIAGTQLFCFVDVVFVNMHITLVSYTHLDVYKRQLIDGGYITESCYRNWVNRGRIKVVRRGGGAAGNCALVALNSLPTECLERVKEDNPGGTEQALLGY